jgi:hypothetical protein
MKSIRSAYSAACLAGLLACCGAAAASQVGGDQAGERHSLSAGGSLSVSNNLPGSVTISAWDKSEVAVTGLSGCGPDRWEFGGSPSDLTLTVKLPGHSRDVADCELQVQVPADAQITLKTISADVSLAGTVGALKVTTVTGDMVLKTSSPDVSLQTVSGDLRVAGVQGKLIVRTVSGNLALSGAKVSDLDFNTTSGDVDLDSLYAANAHVAGASLSGSITLHLPKAMSGNVLLKGSSGDLPCDHDGSAAAHPRRSAGGFAKSCEYVEGDGKGASLVLSSQSGDLKIE